MLLSKLTHFAKKLLSRLSTAAIGNIIPFPTSAALVQRGAGKVVALPVLNGLHHSYVWAT